MEWNALTSTDTLAELTATSNDRPVLIYKHSTRCPISAAALGRIEHQWDAGDPPALDPYYLDLIAHRDVSGAVTETYGIPHESPQALLLHGGKVVFHSSHSAISLDEISTKVKELA
ncbi:MAG: bacillithiol system redox-active protein YtxJ [Catalinimonas sp.]